MHIENSLIWESRQPRRVQVKKRSRLLTFRSKSCPLHLRLPLQKVNIWTSKLVLQVAFIVFVHCLLLWLPPVSVEDQITLFKRTRVRNHWLDILVNNVSDNTLKIREPVSDVLLSLLNDPAQIFVFAVNSEAKSVHVLPALAIFEILEVAHLVEWLGLPNEVVFQVGLALNHRPVAQIVELTSQSSVFFYFKFHRMPVRGKARPDYLVEHVVQFSI